jgi:hypothetical protein
MNKVIFLSFYLFLFFCLFSCDKNKQKNRNNLLNKSPIAHAGNDIIQNEGFPFILDGSKSKDPDGYIVSYHWSQTDGFPKIALKNKNSKKLHLLIMNLSKSTSFQFTLTVKDNKGKTHNDHVRVDIEKIKKNIRFFGKVSYDRVQYYSNNVGLSYNNIQSKSIRGATVELLSESKQLIQTTQSDEYGVYQFMVEPYKNYIIRVKAELKRMGTPSWNFSVVNNTNQQALYVMDSSLQKVKEVSLELNLRAESGWENIFPVSHLRYTKERVAAPFAILDTIYNAKMKLLSAESLLIMPPLKLNWSSENKAFSGDKSIGEIGTSFFSEGEMYLLGDDGSDTDEYDEHVILHEFAHYIEDSFSRSDSPGGEHGSQNRLDIRLAFSEGWGNALSGIISEDIIYKDSFGENQNKGDYFNIKSDYSLEEGAFSETSIQSLIYSLYDNKEENMDHVHLEFSALFEALQAQKNSSSLTSIYSFMNYLKIKNPNKKNEINLLLESKNIKVNDAFASGERNNGGVSSNLPFYHSLSIGNKSTVCTHTNNGFYNKLGNYKYIYFKILNTGLYTITKKSFSGRNISLMKIFLKGKLSMEAELTENNPSLSQHFDEGTYIMTIIEKDHYDSVMNKNVCTTIQLTPN